MLMFLAALLVLGWLAAFALFHVTSFGTTMLLVAAAVAIVAHVVSSASGRRAAA